MLTEKTKYHLLHLIICYYNIDSVEDYCNFLLECKDKERCTKGYFDEIGRIFRKIPFFSNTTNSNELQRVTRIHM